MIVHEGLPEKPNQVNRAIALGFFDGVHLGHQKLINILVEKSQVNNLRASVFTFKEHPRRLTQNTGNFPGLIQTTEMRLDMLRHFGVEESFLIPMIQKLRYVSAEDFYFHYLVDRLNAKILILGQDARFGYQGQGNVEKLKEWTKKTGVDLYVAPDVRLNGIKVSSTYIRNLLQDGDMGKVNQCLGYPYQIKAEVLHGKKLGRTLGFPTINMEYDPSLIIPKHGVYRTNVVIQDVTYPAITSIGTNPTVEKDNAVVKVESYIYDETFDLYNTRLYVEFLEFIRPEIKFLSIEEMTNRILYDLELVRDRHFKKH